MAEGKRLTSRQHELVNRRSSRSFSQFDHEMSRYLDMREDRRKDQRLRAIECKNCFYVAVAKRIVGHAFTRYKCFICGVEGTHPNTGVPEYCAACAKEHQLCVACGGDINMEQRAKPKRKARA